MLVFVPTLNASLDPTLLEYCTVYFDAPVVSMVGATIPGERAGTDAVVLPELELEGVEARAAPGTTKTAVPSRAALSL